MDEKFNFVAKLQEQIGPLKVKVELTMRDQVYYLVVDGTEQASWGAWDKYWGGFSTFASGYVREHIKADGTLVAPAIVEFRIGTLLDLLKDIE